jgi:hypothetical protein
MLAKRFYMCGYIPTGKRCTSFPCSKRIDLFIDRSDLCALVIIKNEEVDGTGEMIFRVF